MKILRTNRHTFRNFISEYITGFHRHRRKLVCRSAQLAVTVSLLGLLALHLVQYTNIEELSTDIDSRVLDGREKQVLKIENYEREEEEKEELEREEGERKRRVGEGERGEGRRRGRLSNQLKLQELTQTNINIRVVSSKDRVSVSVDNTLMYEDHDDVGGRGIHVLVLHQGTGALMASRVFDTYSPREDEALTLFVNMVADGRIFVLAIKDEGTFQLKPAGRRLLRELGSVEMERVGWRDMWGMICIKGEGLISEGYSKSPDFASWGEEVVVQGELELEGELETTCWAEERRREFCDRIEGYGSVCSCDNPAPIVFNPLPAINNQIHNIPVAIIASNRPHYLHRMLQSLLSARGADPDMIVVFIDGFFEETLAVAKLFGLRGVQHAPVGTGTSRISQHYKISLSAIFSMYPRAPHAIVLEEDLDVSPDFFSYFSQTVGLLSQDPSIYCISAWNDLGYEYTSADPSALYRVETMPGLGWMLSRKLFEVELEPEWPTPDKAWDWDMWMRLSEIRKGRECIIPDVPRTFHFGSSGVNMNSYFHDVYFSKHSFNTLPDVELVGVDSLVRDEYESLLRYELERAVAVDYSPCHGMYKENGTNPRVLFIEMKHSKDFTSWLALAKCLHIWDLDARGFHRGLWRLNINQTPFFIVGAPFSPYSRYKPQDFAPLRLRTWKPKTKSDP